MKNNFLLLIVLIFISSCDHSDKNDINRVYYDSDISEIIFERQGGGNISFEVTPVENGYKIVVTQYEFNIVNYEINLTNLNEEVFIYVKNIFNKKIDLYDEVFTTYGATGTWPSVTLIYETHETVKINNVNLKILCDFVRNKIVTMK